jgi:hypothetical protein
VGRTVLTYMYVHWQEALQQRESIAGVLYSIGAPEITYVQAGTHSFGKFIRRRRSWKRGSDDVPPANSMVSNVEIACQFIPVFQVLFIES